MGWSRTAPTDDGTLALWIGLPSAWFYYVLPLVLSIGFVVGGLVLFRRFARGDRDGRGRKYGASTGCGGILFAVVGVTLGLAIVLTSPTPSERQRLFDRIFRTPPEQIGRFVIQAGRSDQYKPLTLKGVVVDDPAHIQRIAAALSAAREVSPNHPQTEWSARVERVTRDGTVCFTVTATVPGDPNGTLVHVSSDAAGGGWNLGSFRVDDLEPILAGVVAVEAR